MSETYKCIDCNKIYSNYNSLWTHNKKFHKIVQEKDDEYGCRTCNKIYKHDRTRINHEKTCNNNSTTSLELEVEKTKVERTKIEVEKLEKEKEILKLQIKLQGMKRIDNKTFKYINKFLMDRSPINNNTMNNTMNNTINNHYHFPPIMGLGNENLLEKLTLQEKKEILDRRLWSLETMVQMVHCGKHDMFKNIIITNLKDKFAYKYDETKGYFITTTKKDVLDDLVANRMMDIEAIYDELSSANKIDSKTKKLIQEFLDKMENENTYVNDEIEYQNFKSYKMNNIKILLYNNHDRMTKDIAFLIGDIKLPNQEDEIV